MKPLCSTGVQQFLSVPEAPHKIPTVNPKSCGRVLTSQENMDMLTKKAEEKRDRNREAKKKTRKRSQVIRKASREGGYVHLSKYPL